MGDKFPNLVRDSNLQIQEAEWIPNRINPKRSIRYFIVKLRKTKDKLKLLEVAREKWHLTNGGGTIQKISHHKLWGPDEVA